MKVLVVDDHVLIREAMRGVLKELDPACSLLEAASANEAAKLVAETPDLQVVLLDLQLPDRDGLELLAELRENQPALAIVMISGRSDRETVLRALDAGSQGFIPKTQSREVLMGALRLVLAGGIYIPPDALQRTTAPAAPSPTRKELQPAGPSSVKPTPADFGLTERQLEVLGLMMQGKSNKLICRALDLAEPTVKNHVSAVLSALGVSNRTEAVIAVTAFGWDLPKLKG